MIRDNMVPRLPRITFATLAILMTGTACPVDDDGFVSLFDGETLNGWTQRNGFATYRAEDGAIVGQTALDSPNSFLCTNAIYANFELELEVFLRNSELNSGVQIRSQSRESDGRVNGPQVEIEASGESGAEAGYLYCEACHNGWMTPEELRVPHTAFRDGEWNAYRVIANGPRIQTWVNGEMISDLVDEAVYATHPEGFIGLQVHGVGNAGPYEVAWRDIRIKPLPSTDPNGT